MFRMNGLVGDDCKCVPPEVSKGVLGRFAEQIDLELDEAERADLPDYPKSHPVGVVPDDVVELGVAEASFALGERAHRLDKMLRLGHLPEDFPLCPGVGRPDPETRIHGPGPKADA